VVQRLAVLGNPAVIWCPKDGNLGYPVKKVVRAIFARTTAFRRIPPVHRTTLKGALRVELTRSQLASRRVAPGAAHALNRTPLSRAFRSLLVPILLGTQRQTAESVTAQMLASLDRAR
jgi:hypothetical protein